MGLTKAQTVIICLVIIFSAILLASLVFAFYSSRKARKEDEENKLAVLGRWKEIGQVVVKGVPHPAPQPHVMNKQSKSELELPPRGASLTSATNSLTPTPTPTTPAKAITRPTNGRRFSGLAGIGIPGFLPDSKAISLQADKERGLSQIPLATASLSRDSLSAQNGSWTAGSEQSISVRGKSAERGRKGEREREGRKDREGDSDRTKRRGRERERGDSQRRKDKERRRR